MNGQHTVVFIPRRSLDSNPYPVKLLGLVIAFFVRNAGGHIWGLLWLRPSANLEIWAEELYLIWEASEAEEWIDRVDWIPF